jgi:transcriptional regulator with XRE-family HTH domain
MGRASRHIPVRLAEKLRDIRLSLGLSQSEMLKRLDVEDLIAYQRISEYELGKREPLLLVLLAYARVANISTDILIDDETDLPATLTHTRRRR